MRPVSFDLVGTYDLNRDGVVDYQDLRFLVKYAAIWNNEGASQFDLNQDGTIDMQDGEVWRREAWPYSAGDVNLDGAFDDADLEMLARESTIDTDADADWQHGDFDGDGKFTTSDLVLAMSGGLGLDGDSRLTRIRQG